MCLHIYAHMKTFREQISTITRTVYIVAYYHYYYSHFSIPLPAKTNKQKIIGLCYRLVHCADWCAGGSLGSSLRIHICQGVKTGLSRRRRWSLVDPSGNSEAGWPCRGVPNWSKGCWPFYHCTNQSLDLAALRKETAPWAKWLSSASPERDFCRRLAVMNTLWPWKNVCPCSEERGCTQHTTESTT